MACVLLDERSGIGPHHLGIGKTRKLFRSGDFIFAFFSRGYEIAFASYDLGAGAVLSIETLGVPVSWGGGAFCVDDDGKGRVVMAFVHRDLRQLCFVEGQASAGKIDWQPWRPILSSTINQAAPWLSLDGDGMAWITVLERAGNFRIATVTPQGVANIGNLFLSGEPPWHHSCVQALPIGKGRAAAVGFRGTFPTSTELVGKMIGPGMAVGPSASIFPCDVNDHTTFHFQALGDPARNQAHIVYLDQGLTVSHAVLTGETWRVEKSVMPFACLAPQLCLDDSGEMTLLAGDYQGRVIEARKSQGGSWSAPSQIAGLTAPNISPLFGLTGYGTGGMISDARSRGGVVPFLAATILDEKTAKASLSLHIVGKADGYARSPVPAQDTAPFAEETNAMMAQHPDLITRTYKRMV